MTLSVGDKAPLFSLPGDNGNTIDLAAILKAGKNAVVYFYPKDDTPGCTTEAKDFTAAKDAFDAANTVVIGMSKDTAAKHDKFIAKHELAVALASDETGETIESYGSWVEKNMYGRTYMGIERSTFLIDASGTVREIWRKVRVKGHVDKVLDAANAL